MGRGVFADPGSPCEAPPPTSWRRTNGFTRTLGAKVILTLRTWSTPCSAYTSSYRRSIACAFVFLKAFPIETLLFFSPYLVSTHTVPPLKLSLSFKSDPIHRSYSNLWLKRSVTTGQGLSFWSQVRPLLNTSLHYDYPIRRGIYLLRIIINLVWKLMILHLKVKVSGCLSRHERVEPSR